MRLGIGIEVPALMAYGYLFYLSQADHGLQRIVDGCQRNAGESTGNVGVYVIHRGMGTAGIEIFEYSHALRRYLKSRLTKSANHPLNMHLPTLP